MKPKQLLLLMMIASASMTFGQIIEIPAHYSSIQAGINAASDGDTVLVSEGTFYEMINFKGKAITVASQFLLDGDTSHVSATVIDGYQLKRGDSASVVSFISGEDTTSILCGFTLRGGQGTLTNVYGGARIGGGIFIYNSGAKITGNRVVDNSVSHDYFGIGGGIGCFQADVDTLWLVVEGNTISQNMAYATGSPDWRSAAGGGMYAYSNARVEDNTIEGNECQSTYAADGAGVEFESPGPFYWMVYFKNNLVKGNTATGDELAFGGGISNYFTNMVISGNEIRDNELHCDVLATGGGINILGWSSFGDNVEILDNEITGNTLSGDGYAYGSAVQIQNVTHKVLLRDNLIAWNDGTASADSYGAVSIWNYSDSFSGKNAQIMLDGNHFKHNTNEYGGAVYASNSFNLALTNNFFLGNQATYGGAVYFTQFSNKAGNGIRSREETRSYLANNTMVMNEASLHGGAIYNSYTTETVVTFNNIFWMNDALKGEDAFSSSDDPIVIAYSDINPDFITGEWQGTGNFSNDPEFTQDSLHIEQGSPCINQGVESYTAGEFSFNCPETDIDGEARPTGNGIDVGADENLTVGMAPAFHVNKNGSISVSPNPVISHARIGFELKSPVHCRLVIYHSTGEEAAVILDKRMPEGTHEINWRPAGMAEGLYVIRLNAGSKVSTARIILLK